jgi:NitT/TauT family transport system substrate-binding protein
MKYASQLILCVMSFGSITLGAASAQKLETLKVVIGGKGLGESAVSEAGQKAGHFRKHGLDLDILYTAGAGETMQVLISGNADLGIGVGLLGVIGAYSKGAPVRIIGASYTGDSNLFWYVPAESQIKAPNDAAGKTVAFSTNGSSAHNVVLQMQKQLGTTFKPSATGSAAATFTQVMSRQIDVGWSGAPFGIEALEQGKIRVIWRASDVASLARQTSRVIVANATSLKTKGDSMERYMNAYRETIEWMYSTPEGVAAYAAWAEIPLPFAHRTMKEFVTREGINPDKVSDLDSVMKSAVEFRYIQGPLTPSQINELIQIPSRK